MTQNILNKIIDKCITIIGQSVDFNINKKPLNSVKLVIDTFKYSIYEYKVVKSKVVAAFGEMIVIQHFWNRNRLTIYPFRNNKIIKFNIYLNKKNFPGLLDNSEILSCQLIPYLRETDNHKYTKLVRLIVITSKSQIYHNYPARGKGIEGHYRFYDIKRFEESVIWDLPGRRYPSNYQNCAEYEQYYPNLPDSCYEYHPAINTSNSYIDLYGNGGFPAYTMVWEAGQKKIVSRFYLYARTPQSNPFYFIGTGERSYKLSIMGTYRGNVHEGVRTCIFASSDGGRNWYCKYEFADFGQYEFRQGDVESWGRNFGNPILNRGYRDEDWKNIKIFKRNLFIPEAIDQNEKFKWVYSAKVKKICCDDGIILDTGVPHNLFTGNIVALCSDKPHLSCAWMINNNINEYSSGTGILFKVEYINSHCIKLYELVSTAENNIPCRHIHHINRIKDGWIIGTGEIYPNGWVLYMQMKEADTYSLKHAEDEFKIFRLNSLSSSIQRTMGIILLDDDKNTLYYASDHDTLLQKEIKIRDGSEVISRGSTGIYKGKLDDIEERKKFTCIVEMDEPCFYFQRLDNMIIFCGQRGEVAISFDEGKSWQRERISEPIIHYYGNVGQIYYFDTCIIKRK